MDKIDLLKIGITGTLMEDDQGRVHVVGKSSPDGKDVSIGWIRKELIYRDPDAARLALSKIRFSPRK